ncbi:hypothetical protein ACQP1K_09945 [Sphaerimonospora sp. CA-214678]|uniref:hypothetical protein n=1 Tax=Sphaerimonospora sp. CA-214678 TaxID=3240029 RepID=UPI003D934B9E
MTTQMPSIMERIRNYLNSQSGRQHREKARDPHTRQRLRHFVDQWRGQRHRH